MTDNPPHQPSLNGYHAHVYYDAATRPIAQRLAAAIGGKFDVKFGGFLDGPVGPHPVANLQIIFTTAEFQNLVPWLMLNREGLDILIHPLTDDSVDDHSRYAMWLGTPVPLKLETLRRKYRRRVADRAIAGRLTRRGRVLIASVQNRSGALFEKKEIDMFANRHARGDRGKQGRLSALAAILAVISTAAGAEADSAGFSITAICAMCCCSSDRGKAALRLRADQGDRRAVWRHVQPEPGRRLPDTDPARRARLCARRERRRHQKALFDDGGRRKLSRPRTGLWSTRSSAEWPR